uniref:peptidylprolyl isomerase n=1 Tax=Cuerna arida TaxID=1464854 RepID=A0A1B6F5A3_9HEMI
MDLVVLSSEQVPNNPNESKSSISLPNIFYEIRKNHEEKVTELSETEYMKEDVKEDEWLDILGDGQILKRTTKKGKLDTKPQRSDVCTIKYIGKLDGNVVDEDEVTINIGDGEVIQGLDLVLPLMDLEEESEVIVGPQFAYGPEGRQPDILPDATLHYNLTLLSYEPKAPLETLTLQQRKEIGNRKKERGNYWYSRKEHTLAIQCYWRALEYLNDHEVLSSEETEIDEVHSLLEDQIIVYNNLAAAQMKNRAFDSALQAVDNVLSRQPNNVKALFRKGKVLAAKGETEEGILLLKKTLILDPDNTQAKNELTQLLARQKKDMEQQRKLYKKMLGSEINKPTEKRSLSPSREVRKWGWWTAVWGGPYL